MSIMRPLARTILLIMLLCSVQVAQAAPLLQGQAGTAVIISPQQGETLRGVVQIIGTASDSEFNHYLIEFGFEPNLNDQWFPIQDPVAQQVQQGPLALWDTAILADGTYQLRLRVVRNDRTNNDVVVRNLVVSNETPALPPTIVPSIVPTVTVGVPTPGPSPTALIQQPPTRTPRPQVAPAGPTFTPTPDSDVFLEARQVRGAACRGVVITTVIFGLLAGYGLLRTFARSQMRSVGLWLFKRLAQLIDKLSNRSERGG